MDAPTLYLRRIFDDELKCVGSARRRIARQTLLLITWGKIEVHRHRSRWERFSGTERHHGQSTRGHNVSEVTTWAEANSDESYRRL